MKPHKLQSEVISILTDRLADEYTAYYFYLCAANYCNNIGYFRAGNFFKDEAANELSHAQIIMDYLVKWNVQPVIQKTDTNHSFENLYSIIEDSYELEYNLLTKYNDGSSKLFKSDLNTFDFLQQFRTIQTDSVAEYSDLLNKLELIDTDDKFQMYMFELNNF